MKTQNSFGAIATALALFATVSAAQNHWELLGCPLAYEQPSLITANHISSGLNPIGGLSVTYALEKNEIFVSMDQGLNWLLRPGLSGEIIAAEHENGLRAWLGDMGTNATGTWWTADGGVSWIPRINGLLNLQVRALAIDPENPAIVICGCQADAGNNPTIYRWNEAGTNWAAISAGISNNINQIADLAILDDGVHNPIFLAAIANSGQDLDGVWQSNDNGNNWSRIEHDPTLININDIEAIIEGDQSYLYVAAKLDDMSHLLRYSFAMGLWEDINALPGYPMWFELRYISPNYLQAYLAPSAWFAYETSPGVLDFSFPPSLDPRLGGLEVDVSNSRFAYTSTPQCFYRFNFDTENWEPIMLGMDQAPLGLVAVNGIYIAAAHGLSNTPNYPFCFDSQDGGSTFFQAKWLYKSQCSIFDLEFSSSSWYYMLGQYYSENEGAHWGDNSCVYTSVIGEPLTSDYYEPNAYLYDLDIHPYPSAQSYALAGGEIHYNSVTGQTTNSTFMILNPSTGWGFHPIREMTTTKAVAADPTTDPGTGNAIYYAAGIGGVFKSTNSAATWRPLNDGLPGGLTFTDIIVNNNGQRRYLATSNGVYLLRDGVNNWELKSDGIPADYRNILDLEFGARDDYIFCIGANAAGQTKVFGSRNSADLWSDITGELPNEPIRNIRHSANNLYVGTSDGLYRLTVHLD